MLKKYGVEIAGFLAFVIGGLVTRSKVMDACETLGKDFAKPKK